MQPPLDSQGTTRTAGSRLTTSNLHQTESFTVVDKTLLLKSYLQSQYLYRGFFASEGLQARSTWDAVSDADDNKPPSEIGGVGFATPILKPRVPESKVARDEDAGKSRKDETTKKRNSDGEVKEPQGKAGRSAARSPRKGRKQGQIKTHTRNGTLDEFVSVGKGQKVADKKSDEGHDNERAAILSDRRERRRIKKAIVEAKALTEEDPLTPAKAKKKLKKANDISAGLALMHGFTATNIGSSRLTVKPTFGVFNKGKASAKANVAAKARRNKFKCTQNIWQESKFLNGHLGSGQEKSDDSAQTNSRPSEGSSVSFVAAEPSRPIKKRRVDSPRLKKVTKETRKCAAHPIDWALEGLFNGSGKEKSSMPVPSSDPPARPESIVWDIESTGPKESETEHAADNSKPRAECHPVSEDTSLRHDGTVVLNTMTTKWNVADSAIITEHATTSKRRLQAYSDLALDDDDPPNSTKHSFSPARSSLCPSQSVSQVMHVNSRNPGVGPLRSSKYFEGGEQSCAEAKSSVDRVPRTGVASSNGHFDTRAPFEVRSTNSYVIAAPFERYSAQFTEATAHNEDYFADGSHLPAGLPTDITPPSTGSRTELSSCYDPHSRPLYPLGYMMLTELSDHGELFPEGVSSAIDPFSDVELGSGDYSEAHVPTIDLHQLPDVGVDLVSAQTGYENCPASAYWDARLLDRITTDEPMDPVFVNSNDTNNPLDSYNPDPFDTKVMYAGTDVSGCDYDGTGIMLSAISMDEQSQPFILSQTFSPHAASDVNLSDKSSEASAPNVDVIPGSLELRTVYQVEEDVAKHLRGHWLPQRL